MKTQVDKKLRARPRFAFKVGAMDLVMILLPALFWAWGASYGRSAVIHPRCASSPQTCTNESVFPVDRLSIGMEDGEADGFSYLTQNVSGIMGLAIPPLANAARWISGSLSPAGALVSAATDLVIVLQAAIWNGALTELSHLVTQRPRPFVYTDPAYRGIDPAHYTSFYSGHTSFVAVIQTMLFALLWKRKAPWPALLLFGVMGGSFILSTAYFRILAGRHFLTDVMSGAVAGALVALVVLRVQTRRGVFSSQG